MSKVICHSCGKGNVKGTSGERPKFCGYCGSSLKVGGSSSAAAPTRQSVKIVRAGGHEEVELPSQASFMEGVEVDPIGPNVVKFGEVAGQGSSGFSRQAKKPVDSKQALAEAMEEFKPIRESKELS